MLLNISQDTGQLPAKNRPYLNVISAEVEKPVQDKSINA